MTSRPRRCIEYHPQPGDPDQRSGAGEVAEIGRSAVNGIKARVIRIEGALARKKPAILKMTPRERKKWEAEMLEITRRVKENPDKRTGPER